MPTSEEDLQRKAEELQKLREQVQDAETVRVEREREIANDVTMRQLEAEEAALRARLAVAKDAGKVAAVKSGAAAPLEAVKEQLQAATAQQKAAEKTGARTARATESTADGGAGGDVAATSATGKGGN